MIAISVHQPHAWLLTLTLNGVRVKPYESRYWTDPYRGPIAIHAAKSKDSMLEISRTIAYRKSMGQWPPQEEGFLKSFYEVIPPGFKFADLPTGCIVATGELVAIYDGPKLYPKLTGHARHFGDFGKGTVAWRIDNIKVLPKLVPARGQKGLWEWNP